MEEVKKISVMKKLSGISELSEPDMNLMKHAREAVNSAYAPYSHFHVGCAVLLENGSIVSGSNQENIAYPSGLCAERVALFHAGSQYPDIAVVAMAITARAEGYIVRNPVTSCGACLQVMSEFEMRHERPMRVIMQGEDGEVFVAEGVQTFMPFRFFVKELKG